MHENAGLYVYLKLLRYYIVLVIPVIDCDHNFFPDVSTVSASDISIILAASISSFLIGLVVGISAASIVLICTWRMKKRRGMLPSRHSVDCQPSQAYEDVDIVKLQDMQLQQNVAYGQVKGL